jgi:glycosyltransferase involved in cell wall biosynthesis
MPTDRLDAVVLHVALDPITGVWSVMRDLAMAQSASQSYARAGIGVISSTAWPDCYAKEWEEIGLPFYRSKTVKLPGTPQFLWQRLKPPPINEWAEDLMNRSQASQAIIHFHNAWMSGVFFPLRIGARGNIRAIATMHGMFANFGRRPVRHWLHRWMASRLTQYRARLTSVDKSGTLEAERLLGIPHDLFTVISNGVSENKKLRANEWIGQGVFQLGYLGNLEQRKGWEIGAQAVLDLRNRGKNVRYIIAGSGPQSEQARAWQRKHPDVIEYLGHVAQPRTNFLPKLHALALMSSSEGLPMSIIEALAARLPVIATAVGGLSEALTDGVNALLVSRDSASLAKAILKIHDQPDDHARLGAEGHRLFLKCFELNRIVREYHDLYLNSLRDFSISSIRGRHGTVVCK